MAPAAPDIWSGLTGGRQKVIKALEKIIKALGLSSGRLARGAFVRRGPHGDIVATARAAPEGQRGRPHRSPAPRIGFSRTGGRIGRHDAAATRFRQAGTLQSRLRHLRQFDQRRRAFDRIRPGAAIGRRQRRLDVLDRLRFRGPVGQVEDFRDASCHVLPHVIGAASVAGPHGKKLRFGNSLR